MSPRVQPCQNPELSLCCFRDGARVTYLAGRTKTVVRHLATAEAKINLITDRRTGLLPRAQSHVYAIRGL